MFCNILLFLLLLNVISSQDNIDMNFKVRTDTFAYYKNSKLYQDLKKKLGFDDSDYDYGFLIGNLDKVEKLNSFGDLGIKLTKKNGETVNSQARCGETEYIRQGYQYFLFCNAKQEFASVEIKPQDTDTIEIQGYENIRFSVDGETDNIDDYSTILKGKYMALIFAVFALFL